MFIIIAYSAELVQAMEIILFSLVVILSYFSLTNTAQSPNHVFTHLRLIEVSPHRVRGIYSTNNGGIEFDSMAAKNHHSFSISTTEGRNLMTTVQHDTDGPMGISLFNKKFILVRDQDVTSEYLVPERLHKYVDSTIRHKRLMSVLQNQFDTNSNATRAAAITEFILSREANLVIDAARAVGNRGIMGKDSPAIMRLYLMAIQLQNLVAEENYNEKLDNERVEFSQNVAESQKKDYCTNSKIYCDKGKCPGANKCEGMCGPSCNCWKWVCGNCCWNKMCYDHDQCCTKDWFSWGCIGITFKEDLFLYCHKPYSC